MTAYGIDSELSEKQIEADVAEYFGFRSRFLGEYRLLDTDETVTGADKRLDWEGVSYFLQFKKSVGLKRAGGPVPRRKNESQKQVVRRFRHDNQLDDDPHSLCFELREPSQKSTSLQHNILRRYERPPVSRALYVSPLELTRKAYLDALSAAEGAPPFFHWRGLWIGDGEHVARAAEICPFLRAHVSIVPHAEVDTWRHHYSFSRHATDVAFHDPRVLQRRSQRLSKFVARELRYHLDHPDVMLPLEPLVAILQEAGGDELPDDLRDRHVRSPFDWLEAHARFLEEKFEIRQFVVLRRLGPSR